MPTFTLVVKMKGCTAMTDPTAPLAAALMASPGWLHAVVRDPHAADDAAAAILAALPPEALQAWRDGLALAALQADLPGYAPRFSFGNYVDEEARTVFYRVWHIRPFDGPDDRGLYGEGPTIEAAANAAREALR